MHWHLLRQWGQSVGAVNGRAHWVTVTDHPAGHSVVGDGVDHGPRTEDHMIGALILGLVAGFLGKLLMPGKDPGGFIVTIILGLVGSFVGYLVFTRLLGIGDDDAFDLGGLLSAVIGVMIVLGVYRVAVGRKAT